MPARRALSLLAITLLVVGAAALITQWVSPWPEGAPGAAPAAPAATTAPVADLLDAAATRGSAELLESRINEAWKGDIAHARMVRPGVIEIALRFPDEIRAEEVDALTLQLANGISSAVFFNAFIHYVGYRSDERVGEYYFDPVEKAVKRGQ